jgi:subtilisin family serine protease
MTRFMCLIIISCSMLSLLFAPGFAAGPEVMAVGERMMAVAPSAGAYEALREDLVKSGVRIISELPEIHTFVVVNPGTLQAGLQASSHLLGMARDRVVNLVRPEMKEELFNSSKAGERIPVDLRSLASPVSTGSAFTSAGLMWNVRRIGAPQAWEKTKGSPSVVVGVADTGLDFTHSELASKISASDVVDLTVDESPPICSTAFGVSDADLSARYGGPAITDWNGHGTWIGGNISAALDAAGFSGIAPGVKLVPLKISQWCGAAYESSIIASFLYAADHQIDIVSISFGGYVDRSTKEGDLVYNQYVKAVKYARSKGTIIVAAAGNEHVNIGAGGKVLSHGSLTTPGSDVEDLYGLYEVPGGIPGVITVSATGNITNASQSYCSDNAVGNINDLDATCKPATDIHKPIGAGKRDQLAYSSNYGSRIDVAAPGGARKFNLPASDRGGTPGWPVTQPDGFNVWEDFSITSNWAVDIPCYTFIGGGFPADQCYSSIQGTSMATPHVSAALALIASTYPYLRHNPDKLVFILKSGAKAVGPNATPPLSKKDITPGDLTGVACIGGYCHLGGSPISDRAAYGAGLIDVSRIVGSPLIVDMHRD